VGGLRDAKLRLFEKLARAATPRGPDATSSAKPHPWPATGIVNADDPSAGAFIGVAQEAGARVLTYGTDPAADVRAIRVEEDQHRLRIAYEAPSGAATVHLRLMGRFNVHNALAVVALGEAVGLDPRGPRSLASVRRAWEMERTRPASRSGSSSSPTPGSLQPS
jgi:UDP-N-acetylmuramyl pentapeptide synthase